MDPQVVRRLLQLNRTFYDRLAEPFAASRSGLLPGVERLLTYVPDEGALLDVGCGAGQLAVALDRLGRRVRYVGVDASEEMIRLALQTTPSFSHISARFLVRDVSAPDWTLDLPHQPFQTVAMLAVLHHIPGLDLRVRLLRDVAGCLAPDGYILVSTWQFLNSPRLRRRVQPWARIGLSPGDVEPGDYLLDWQRGGHGLRYCALIDVQALHRLAESAGLRVVETFHAGRDDLNLCAVLRRATRSA